MPEILSVAVCLFDKVTALDYQGPAELFGFLDPNGVRASTFQDSVQLHLTYLSHTLDPVKPITGPSVIPQRTYADAIDKNTQYDVLLIPGGPGARPGAMPPDLLRFLEHQIPGARYLLSVCTGAWILSCVGALDGKRATTNKFTLEAIKESTSDEIKWVNKARWVIDGKIWTSSGGAAGMDMANAFVVHLVGEATAKLICAVLEYTPKGADEDDFFNVDQLLHES